MNKDKIFNGGNMGCLFSDESINRLVLRLESLERTIGGTIDKLIAPATNKDYMPVETHKSIVKINLYTLLVTIALLGGIQAYIQWKEVYVSSKSTVEKPVAEFRTN